MVEHNWDPARPTPELVRRSMLEQSGGYTNSKFYECKHCGRNLLNLVITEKLVSSSDHFGINTPAEERRNKPILPKEALEELSFSGRSSFLKVLKVFHESLLS